MPAIAFQDNDAKQRFPAQFVNGREHAINQAGIIGIVDLRAVQRDRRNPAFIEVPQNRMAGIGDPFVERRRVKAA